jgi:acetylornithine/N-succinyldiaminopimelate aminotransferase
MKTVLELDQQVHRRALAFDDIRTPKEATMATDWKALEQQYYMQCAKRQPIVLVRGEGTHVWDENDNVYLDFTAGWAVNNLCHANPVLANVIAEQAQTLLQTSNQFYTIPQLQAAQLLVQESCFDQVFFCNSGAEANEGAIKLARKFGTLHRNGAHEIMTAFNSFHGRTLTTTAATGQPQYHTPYQPVPAGFTHVPFDDLTAIEAATTDRTVAIMLEPVQGEGGVHVPSPGYLQGVRRWCDDNDLLLIFDEVQTGIGRLGTLFGYQAFGVEPDIISLAKGLGGGVPVGAVLAKEHAAVFEPGDHGSTFGGNVLTCATAHASVRYIIDNDILPHARQVGAHLHNKLQALQSKHACVVQVRGMGLLLAIEFSHDIATEVVSACNDAGLLLNPVRSNVIRFMPPLTVSTEEISEGVEKLDAVLNAVTK